MRSGLNVITDVVGKSLVAILCCLILGFILYQWRLFNLYTPSAQIVLYGVIGSLFFFTLRISRRNSFAVLLVLFVIHLGLLLNQLRFASIAQQSVFYAAVASALYVFFAVFYRRAITYRSLYPLVLATLFAMTFFLATGILFLYQLAVPTYPSQQILQALEINVTNGFVIGLGIGLGVLIIDNGYLRRAKSALRPPFEGLIGTFRDFAQHP